MSEFFPKPNCLGENVKVQLDWSNYATRSYSKNATESLECFTKKNSKRQMKKVFRDEKVIKRKGDKLYVKWKDYDNYFNSWIDKKDRVQMSEYFPELESSGGRVKV